MVNLNFGWARAKYIGQGITTRTSLRVDTDLEIHVYLFIQSVSHNVQTMVEAGLQAVTYIP